MGLQHGNGPSVEVDDARPARLGGGGDLDAVVNGGDGLTDRDAVCLQINVLPEKPESLPPGEDQ